MGLSVALVLSFVLLDALPAWAAGNGIDPVRGDLDASDHATPWGPLSQYDRNLLINVKWANLWEGPISERIANTTTDSKVRAAAAQLSREHHALDEAVDKVAAELGVPLPTQANPLQQAWEHDITSRSGTDADRTWANITRRAHGTVFMLIAQVRAETRNDVIRAFAQQAVDTVMRHMRLLESTNLVRSDSLYVGSTEGAPHQPRPAGRQLVIAAVISLLVMLLTVAAVRAVAGRRLASVAR